MMRDEDPKEKLRELSIQLTALVTQERKLISRGQSFPPTISFEVTDWFLRAAQRFLAGDEADFGGALGFKRGRGRPKKPPSGKNYERAKKIFWMRVSKPQKSWTKIADEFDADVRDLQRELERYHSDIVAENTRELLARMKARPQSKKRSSPSGIK